MSERPRTATVKRKTKETAIDLTLGLDRSQAEPLSGARPKIPRGVRAGQSQGPIRTGVPFLDHMLTLFSAHGGFDLAVRAKGDLEVDDHHLVEDLGICLGQAVAKALGDKKGIRRYGDACVPMDESLVLVAIDISGRAYLGYGLTPSAPKIKTFATDLVEEFFLGFMRNVPCTMHVRQLTPKGNAHHQVEAAFKSFGQALGMAVERKGRIKGVPSTKGML